MFRSTRIKWPTTRTARRPSRARRRLALPLVLGWLIFWLTTAANAACDLPITAKPLGQSAASAIGIAVPADLAEHQHAPGQERAHCPGVSAANFDTSAAASPSSSLPGSGGQLSSFDYTTAWNGAAARNELSSTPQSPPGLPLYLRTARLLI